MFDLAEKAFEECYIDDFGDDIDLIVQPILDVEYMELIDSDS